MSDLISTDRVHAPLGKRGAFEGVARRHGRRRNPARRPPPSSLRTLTNQPRHSTQRWVEKCDRSVANSETPHVHESGSPVSWVNRLSLALAEVIRPAIRSLERACAAIPAARGDVCEPISCRSSSATCPAPRVIK